MDRKNVPSGGKNEFGKFNSGASPTEPIVDEWRILEKIVDIVKFEERLKITYQLGNENIDFVISAPSLGGIRITTTESSFLIRQKEKKFIL